MIALPPLSLYIHIPWCIKKCPYCDFNSHEAKTDLPKQAYIDALVEDLKADAHYIQSRPIETIFIGGGTPSLLEAHYYEQLLNRIRQIVPIVPSAEITMEANPGAVEHDQFIAYRAAGITRISLGVQSFGHDKLKALGRVHDEHEAVQAAHKVREAGFEAFNIDLMHGLPSQNLAQALHDLEQAAQLKPNHISWYQLTIEKNTLFHSRPPKLPQEEDLWSIYAQGKKRLEDLGYRQYEISGYSQNNTPCQHNLNYWRFGDYLGIGCGSHGKITLPIQNRLLRTTKIKHPKGYLEKKRKIESTQAIKPEDRALEYFMNHARLLEPMPMARFESRTGLNRESIQDKMNIAAEKGLILNQDHSWQLTEKGVLFINEFLGCFL
jgi:putative oxygen-independent coproporphyrinogen III oxidase